MIGGAEAIMQPWMGSPKSLRISALTPHVPLSSSLKRLKYTFPPLKASVGADSLFAFRYKYSSNSLFCF